jgi:hypothetical protein
MLASALVLAVVVAAVLAVGESLGRSVWFPELCAQGTLRRHLVSQEFVDRGKWALRSLGGL